MLLLKIFSSDGLEEVAPCTGDVIVHRRWLYFLLEQSFRGFKRGLSRKGGNLGCSDCVLSCTYPVGALLFEAGASRFQKEFGSLLVELYKMALQNEVALGLNYG